MSRNPILDVRATDVASTVFNKTTIFDPDTGRFEHTFRQSGLKTATICLERARLEWSGEMPDIESDAAAVGTAVHAALEADLLGYKATGDHFDQESLVELFNMEFSDLMAGPNFAWIKYNETQARDFGAKCVRHYYQELMPQLRPIECELNFTVLLWEDDKRTISLNGTMDLIDARIGIADFKTSGGGKYQEWQYRRWAIQPTAYTYACHTLGMTDISNKFTYLVMSKDGVQQFTVERDAGWWRWLKDQAVRLAELIERDVPRWPTNDTHALCSDKWCPAWSQCKGSHL